MGYANETFDYTDKIEPIVFILPCGHQLGKRETADLEEIGRG